MTIHIHIPSRRQSKTFILATNVDKKNRKKQGFRMPFVARLATNGNRKHCFYRFFIRVRRLLRAFSIAAYPVWYTAKIKLIHQKHVHQGAWLIAITKPTKFLSSETEFKSYLVEMITVWPSTKTAKTNWIRQKHGHQRSWPASLISLCMKL